MVVGIRRRRGEVWGSHGGGLRVYIVLVVSRSLWHAATAKLRSAGGSAVLVSFWAVCQPPDAQCTFGRFSRRELTALTRAQGGRCRSCLMRKRSHARARLGAVDRRCRGAEDVGAVCEEERRDTVGGCDGRRGRLGGGTCRQDRRYRIWGR